MAFLDSGSHASVWKRPSARSARPRASSLRLEPLVGLEWSHAMELAGGVMAVREPSDLRRAWIHRAAQAQVVALFRAVSAANPGVDAPWWLRAVAADELDSRASGFAVEDAVEAVLRERAGWVYAAWDGRDDGYWEYTPSETGPDGLRIPTALRLTSRHSGWLDVVPAHTGKVPAPIAIDGVRELSARLDDIEHERFTYPA